MVYPCMHVHPPVGIPVTEAGALRWGVLRDLKIRAKISRYYSGMANPGKTSAIPVCENDITRNRAMPISNRASPESEMDGQVVRDTPRVGVHKCVADPR